MRPIIKFKGKAREGRGFSYHELKSVGISIQRAIQLSLPVDRRRRTCWIENVNMLREFLKKKGEVK